MRFNPLSEEEAAAQSADLLSDGQYDYEIREATEEVSKASGADMLKLEVWVYAATGDRRLVFDYLVNSERAAWRLRSFAESCNLLEQYKTGSLMVADIVGRTGRCQIATQKADATYPAKNIIKGYVKAKATGAPPSPRKPVPAGAGTDLDDEIPF